MSKVVTKVQRNMRPHWPKNVLARTTNFDFLPKLNRKLVEEKT